MPRYEEVFVRDFELHDTEQTADVFFQAVRFGTKDFYSDKQRKAWAPQKPELSWWQTRLAKQTVKVAILDEAVIGFMTLDSDGKIDLAFVMPSAMGTGVSGKLYAAILQEAQLAGLRTLQTEASSLAQQFFKKRGWHTVQQQTIKRDNVELTNFLMELNVSDKIGNSKAKI